MTPVVATTPMFQVDAEISLDYLVATVFRVEADALVAHLATQLHLVPETVKSFRRYPGYTSAVGLFNGAELAVTVQTGVAHNPLVIAPGFVAGATDRALRAFDYQCSRKDVAVDISDDCAFDVVVKAAQQKALREDVVINLAGDWMTPGSPQGRTMYLFKRTSPFFVRIYEHGKLHGGDVACRIEAEVKPEKSPGKMQLARLDPSTIIGMRAFMVELLAEFGIEVDRCKPAYARRQLTDLELRTLHLAAQWCTTLRELLEHHGGDPASVLTAIFEAESARKDRKRLIRDAAARPQAVPLICV